MVGMVGFSFVSGSMDKWIAALVVGYLLAMYTSRFDTIEGSVIPLLVGTYVWHGNLTGWMYDYPR